MIAKTRSFRFITLVLIAVMAAGLTGCRLAEENENKEVVVSDVLCGAFLTFDGEKAMMETAVNKDEFASYKTVPAGRGIVKGEQTENTVKFKGVNGYFVGFIPKIQGNVDDTIAMADNGFTDISHNYNDIDNMKELISKATFLVPTDSMVSYYVYPIYKKEDGTFYTVIENVQTINFTGDTVNTSGSIKTESFTEEKLDGNVTKSTKNSFEITVKTVDPVKKITVKEMNSKDEVIAAADINNNENSRINYKAAPSTDYVIVEETRHNKRTGDYVERSIYTFGKEKEFYHQCNFPSEKDSIGAVSLVISQ